MRRQVLSNSLLPHPQRRALYRLLASPVGLGEALEVEGEFAVCLVGGEADGGGEGLAGLDAEGGGSGATVTEEAAAPVPGLRVLGLHLDEGVLIAVAVDVEVFLPQVQDGEAAGLPSLLVHGGGAFRDDGDPGVIALLRAALGCGVQGRLGLAVLFDGKGEGREVEQQQDPVPCCHG